jgi:hypothetical protein
MSSRCSYPGCSREVFAAGLCRGHFAQRQRGVALAPLMARGPGRGRHMQQFTLRLAPDTIAALGPDPRAEARKILEMCTATLEPAEP